MYRDRLFREDRHAVVGFLSDGFDVVAEILKLHHRKGIVCAFDFLQQRDVRGEFR